MNHYKVYFAMELELFSYNGLDGGVFIDAKVFEALIMIFDNLHNLHNLHNSHQLYLKDIELI